MLMENLDIYEVLNEICMPPQNNQQVFEDNKQQVEMIYKTYINY